MKDTSYMIIYTIIFVHGYAIIVYSTIIIYIFLAIFLFPTFSRFVWFTARIDYLVIQDFVDWIVLIDINISNTSRLYDFSM